MSSRDINSTGLSASIQMELPSRGRIVDRGEREFKRKMHKSLQAPKTPLTLAKKLLYLSCKASRLPGHKTSAE